MLRVLPFVLWATLKNRVLHQVRRLRQPRYALATAVGLAWFWFYAGRHLVAGPRAVPPIPAGFSGLAAIGIAAVGTLLLLLGWIFRAQHRALAMSEAEIQFLFPAPLTRVQVLHWRVLQLLAAGLVGTAFTTLIFGRAASGRPLLFALGAWIAFATVDLHRLGIALTWAAVGEGWSGLRRRAGTFAVLGGLVAFAAWAVTRVDLSGLPLVNRPEAFAAGFRDAVLASPLRLALWPGLTLAGLVLARTWGEFALHLPGALALLGLHYVWVIRSGVAFEEAAVAASERRARLREQLRERRRGAAERKGPRRAPFQLGPHGPVEVAFVWKGLISSGFGKLLGARGAILVLVVAGASLFLASPRGELAAHIVGSVALPLWIFSAVLGAGAIRSDLRLDQRYLDVLRALPVSGTRLVRGEILGAWLPLVAVQWLLLPVVAASTLWMDFPLTSRAAALIAAALLGPALALVSLVLQNAVVVVLPGWIPQDPERGGARGPEAMGLRLVVAIGGLVALSLVVLPAAGVGAAILAGFWFASGALGAGGVLLAACAAAGVLVGESLLAVRLLGAAFDRLDPSET
ncbi:MAG: putative ABC exporter domain-containing protein [Anaeromyxobacteraceae bacterium]